MHGTMSILLYRSHQTLILISYQTVLRIIYEVFKKQESIIFSGMRPYCLVNVYRRFGGIHSPKYILETKASLRNTGNHQVQNIITHKDRDIMSRPNIGNHLQITHYHNLEVKDKKSMSRRNSGNHLRITQCHNP